MRRMLVLLVTNGVSFMLGVAAAIVGIIYLRDLINESITIGGTLRREEHDPEETAGASGLPPEGYYIEGGGRFYIIEASGTESSTYLGQRIRARGELGIACGPDNIECFPALIEAEIIRPRQ